MAYTWDLQELNRTTLAPRTDNAPRREEDPATIRAWQERQERDSSARTALWEYQRSVGIGTLLGGTPEIVWPAEEEPLAVVPFVAAPPRAPGLPPRRRTKARRPLGWRVAGLLVAVLGWVGVLAVLSLGGR